MEEDQVGEKHYEAMLQREAEKMSVRGFKPKVCTDIINVLLIVCSNYKS